MSEQTKRPLVYALQDALGYAQDARDEALASELQTHIDTIKTLEDDYLCSAAVEDCSDENYKSDGECVDFIVESFGFEVGK